MISRSFKRPVINRWPSFRNPRSPVRRNGPSSLSGIRALNVSSVSFAFRQYPCATLGPLIHISPTSPALHCRSESGEMIRTACSTGGRPQATSSLPCFRAIVGSMVHGSDAVRIKTSTYKQSSFSQAITWNKGLATKTTVGELCGKSVHRFQSYWFGAVERHPPRTQVESAPVFRTDFAHAEFVGKVRSAAGRCLIAGNGLKPAKRSLQEGDRRHQDAGYSCVQRLQYIANKPHVMKERQP